MTFKFVSLYNEKRYEPKKRWVGGRYGWAVHRFPIKGGISMRDVMIADMYDNKNEALISFFSTASKSVADQYADAILNGTKDKENE